MSRLTKLLALMLCILFLPLHALAERSYLIPDSDTRRLTEAELWQWDYESLGYILNEIFARHGYNFIPGEKYDYYFRCMPWYTPNQDSNNQRACYSQLTQVEWANEHLVKEVRAAMRAADFTNEGSLSVWDTFSAGFDTLQGFQYVEAAPGQKWPVYSAPDASSWRGAKGKALVSTNGNVYAAGWESGWLLIMYETNNGSVRVGYASAQDMKKVPAFDRALTFDYTPAVLERAAALTDDPARSYSAIVQLPAGAAVTYLTTYFNAQAWAYVETAVDGQRVRGFLPASALSVQSASEDPIG